MTAEAGAHDGGRRFVAAVVGRSPEVLTTDEHRWTLIRKGVGVGRRKTEYGQQRDRRAFYPSGRIFGARRLREGVGVKPLMDADER